MKSYVLLDCELSMNRVFFVEHGEEDFRDHPNVIAIRVKIDKEGKPIRDQNGDFVPMPKMAGQISRNDIVIYYTKGTQRIKGIFKIVSNRLDQYDRRRVKEWTRSPIQFIIKPYLPIVNIDFRELVSDLKMFEHLEDYRQSIRGFHYIKEVLIDDYMKIEEAVRRSIVSARTRQRLLHKPRILQELNEDDISKEVKRISKRLFTGKGKEKIDPVEEFKKLKLEPSPDNIQTPNQVRVQYIVTGSASTNLQKKVIKDFEVYIPEGSDEHIENMIEDIKKFYGFVLEIIEKMVPEIGKKIVLISVEDPMRDAYRYHGRTVFNFNKYLKEKSKFFWFFVAARELAYLLHNRFDYRHNNLMRALLIGAYEKGF
jgi:hypothetical protein